MTTERDAVQAVIEAAEHLAAIVGDVHCPWCEAGIRLTADVDGARERLRQALLDYEHAERMRELRTA